MLKNKTIKKLLSIALLKCPRCREGSLLEKHPYHLKNFNKVNENCPNCGLHFKIEPSFFYGSMYVSYGIGVGISVAVYLLLFLFGYGDQLLQNFFIICGTLILLMPYINALSKVIWASFFFKYDPAMSIKSKINVSKK
ncbi:MAG: DUF983 domain-containing protein [Flavobacteriaceae bacterium]